MAPSRVIRIVVPMLLLSSVARAELVVVAGEFQVNTHTVGQQVGASIAPGAAGGFVAVWSGLGSQDGYSGGVFGQRYASGSVRIGSEFQVNTYTPYGQGSSAIASDAQGRFVVVWDSYKQDDSLYQGVFGQRYDSNGQQAGTEFQVSSYTLASQYDPFVAMTPGGAFVVAWESYGDPVGQDGSYGGIFAQRFASDGNRVGSEFMVNTYTDATAFTAAAASTPDGSFLITWAGSGPEGLRIRGRFYDSAGQPTGPQFDVNEPHALTSLRSPSIARLTSGDFVVAWNHDVASAEEDIHARLLDDSGAPLGTEFLVNTFTNQRQIASSVAAKTDGGFVISWQSNEDGSGGAVMMREYDSSGNPIGLPIQLNITEAGTQGSVSLTETGAGDVMAIWTGDAQDGSFQGIFGVRLVPFGTPLSGKKLLIKNPSGGPSKNKLVFLSKDTAAAAPVGVEGDPRCAPIGSGTPLAGGTLRVVGLGGDFTLDLPCVGWTANASKTKYTYRDASGATCKKVILQDGHQLKAVCKGSQLAYVLGAAQVDVTVILTLGEGLRHCATFGASTLADIKSDGSDGRTYKALDAGAPMICP